MSHNREALRKVADMIEQWPEHFNMDTFVNDPVWHDDDDAERWWYSKRVEDARTNVEVLKAVNLTGCDTTACIAGWAVICYPALVNDDNEEVDEAAARILGLTDLEASRLFYACEQLSTPELAAEALRGIADGTFDIADLEYE